MRFRTHSTLQIAGLPDKFMGERKSLRVHKDGRKLIEIRPDRDGRTVDGMTGKAALSNVMKTESS